MAIVIHLELFVTVKAVSRDLNLHCGFGTCTHRLDVMGAGHASRAIGAGNGQHPGVLDSLCTDRLNSVAAGAQQQLSSSCAEQISMLHVTSKTPLLITWWSHAAVDMQVLHMFKAQRKQYYLFENVLQEQHQYGGLTS